MDALRGAGGRGEGVSLWTPPSSSSLDVDVRARVFTGILLAVVAFAAAFDLAVVFEAAFGAVAGADAVDAPFFWPLVTRVVGSGSLRVRGIRAGGVVGVGARAAAVLRFFTGGASSLPLSASVV